MEECHQINLILGCHSELIMQKFLRLENCMPLKLRRSKTATFSVHKFADSHDYSQITSTQKRDRTFYGFKFTDFNFAYNIRGRKRTSKNWKKYTELILSAFDCAHKNCGNVNICVVIDICIYANTFN